MKVLQQLNESMYIRAIRRGLIITIPLVMAGSFALVLNHLPVQWYQNLMLELFGESWKNFGNYIVQGTFSIISLIVLLSVSYSMSEAYVHSADERLNPLYGSVTALASYIALLRIPNGGLPPEPIGNTGLFLSIFVGAVSSWLFVRLYLLGKLKLRIYSDSADPTVSQAMYSLFPALMTVMLFGLIRLAFDAVGITDLHAAIYEGVAHLTGGLHSANVGSAIAYVFLVHFLWFFGLHGTNIMETAANSLFFPNLAANQELIASGQAATHVYTKEFFDVFVYQGGSGSTICMIIAIMILTRRTNTRQIAKISAIPGLFNVNELMAYGVPIVLNPYFLIPFIGVPLLLTLTTSAAMAMGIVPVVTSSVNWTAPILLSGYQSTGSVAGSILQVFNVALGVVCYAPFVKFNQRHKERENKEALKGLLDCVFSGVQGITARGDSIGNLARSLAAALRDDVKIALASPDKEDNALYLLFQPQVKSDGTLHGAEALMRWKHPQLGLIPPPVVIALAEETGLEQIVCNWTLRKAFRTLSYFNSQGLHLVLSVNVSPTQLSEDIGEITAKEIASSKVDPAEIEIEVTEQLALTPAARRRLGNLKSLGVRLAMDDFGMGHTSLMYLKEFDLDTLKLDGVLVKDVVSSGTSRDIIASIAHLAESSGIELIAEFVEQKEQCDVLREFDCNIYQGYLFSPAIPADELLTFNQSLSSGIPGDEPLK
ncbi:MAG: EAL domain-containing protein [Oscillospiraceae bacterium]|jgi:lactose/cellobiose-specific phosphotransferase system IIC component|nr:EAL domain-containing protein [Oscillospiraceae bacterium]